MRLALRRGAAAPDADDAGSGGPAAVFAGLLDGRRLWVAVAAQPGRLALRRVDTGELIDVPTVVVDDQPGHLGAQLDLAALDGEEAKHDVVLVAPDGTDAQPVTTGPRPATPAGRPSADGRTQHTLVRSPEGHVRVRTTLLPPAAGLLAARALDGAIELTLVDAGRDLALLDEDDVVLTSWPVDDRGVVTLTAASVETLDAVTRPAVTGHEGSWKPVRRRANDLLDPRSAAPLPQLDHPTDDRPRLRLPWSREALLQVRIFPLDEPSP